MKIGKLIPTKSLRRAVGKAGLKIRSVSPEILLVTGIIAGVTCVVAACVQTTKIEPIVDEAKEKINDIKTDGGLTEKEQRKELAKTYIVTGAEIAKVYSLPAALGCLAIGTRVGSHIIMRRRNAALAAAYMGLSEAFKLYRKRVSDEVGAEKEHALYSGYSRKKVEYVDSETGEVKVKEETVYDSNAISPYARFFDVGNPQWCKNSDLNLLFLKGVQNHANDILHSRGYIFLNEVYDLLDIPWSVAGQTVGWVDSSENGDSFVDFGIFNSCSGAARDFVNGYENSILLDFNVDGPIMYIFNGVCDPNRLH